MKKGMRKCNNVRTRKKSYSVINTRLEWMKAINEEWLSHDLTKIRQN